MGSELRMWVSDKLMSLLGYSQSTVVSYVLNLAKKASSAANLTSQLVDDMGMSSSSETRVFAQEIFERVERKKTGPNLYLQQEREAAMLARKQKTYSLLEADDEDDNIVGLESNSVPSQTRKEDTRIKKFRKRVETHGDEDDEVVKDEEDDRRVRRRTSQDQDDSDNSESEEEMLRDQREREELERHIRERDAAGTRKLAEPKLTRKEEEEAIRRADALEQDDIGSLRKVSRREYLKKREQKKLEELRDDLEDEQYLFEGVKLTEAEERELRYKKEIYELVKKRSEDTGDMDEYRIPDAYEVPAPEANAELVSSMQKRQGQSNPKSRSEMFNSHPEEVASGFPIDPPRPSQVVEEASNDPHAQLHKRGSHSGPLSHRAAWAKAGKNMDDAPKLSVADMSAMSGLVAARRSMFSEDRPDKSGSHKQEVPKLIARFPGSYKEASHSTMKQEQKNHALASSHHQNEDGRTSNNDPVLLGYGSKGNKIHYSGPLLVPSGKMDQVLKDHDRHIQEAVRRARLDKAKAKKIQVEGNKLSANSLFVSGR